MAMWPTNRAWRNYHAVGRGGRHIAFLSGHTCHFVSFQRSKIQRKGMHLSQMSVRCVRSHRILSEKQFWHVFDRSTGGEASRFSGSLAGGGATPWDMTVYRAGA
jgi:hypothetical protein